MVEVWGAYSNEGKGDVGTTGNVHVGMVARAAVCLTTGTRQAGLGVVSEAPAIDEHVRRAPRYEGRGGGGQETEAPGAAVWTQCLVPGRDSWVQEPF